MVYTASSLPLAILEMLVNSADLPGDVVYMTVDLPDPPRIDVATLPANWNATPAPIALRRIGDTWVSAGTSAAIAVPSALTLIDDNVLLSPTHKDFAGFAIGPPQAITLDPRLGH